MENVSSKESGFKVADGIVLRDTSVKDVLDIEIDGNVVGYLERAPSNLWWATSNFTVSSGSHKILIRSLNRDCDQAVKCFAEKIRKEFN